MRGLEVGEFKFEVESSRTASLTYKHLHSYLTGRLYQDEEVVQVLDFQTNESFYPFGILGVFKKIRSFSIYFIISLKIWVSLMLLIKVSVPKNKEFAQSQFEIGSMLSEQKI